VPAKGARLVVDASVAGAAGGRTATAPTATRCRDFLETLRQETRCCIVMPPKLKDEWDKHKSVFASRWLVAMASRGRVIFIDVPLSNKMRREIERVAATKKSEVNALRKDFHLVEAAIAHDETVVSLDELVRRLFKAAALGVAAIKKVVWVNPVNSAEQPLVWLRSGTKAENVRMLGYVEPES
jgi:hypothetical protein